MPVLGKDIMIGVEVFDVLAIEEMKWIKVKVIPPWSWHPSVGINGTKEHRKSIQWFDKLGFLWKIIIDGEEWMLPKRHLGYLLEEYERRARALFNIQIISPIQPIELKEAKDNASDRERH